MGVDESERSPTDVLPVWSIENKLRLAVHGALDPSNGKTQGAHRILQDIVRRRQITVNDMVTIVTVGLNRSSIHIPASPRLVVLLFTSCRRRCALTTKA